jgi:hypothetical protein
MEVTVAYLRSYPDIFIKGLRKTMKNLGQDSQYPAEIQTRTSRIQFYSVTSRPVILNGCAAAH